MSKSTTISERLREAIRADGRSLNELGAASGVDPGQLSRFLRHQRNLTLTSAERVSEALGIEWRPVQRRKGR